MKVYKMMNCFWTVPLLFSLFQTHEIFFSWFFKKQTSLFHVSFFVESWGLPWSFIDHREKFWSTTPFKVAIPHWILCWEKWLWWVEPSSSYSHAISYQNLFLNNNYWYLFLIIIHWLFSAKKKQPVTSHWLSAC